VLSLSLVITIFSFVGIPPLMGFFAKQMVLSAALDSGFIFLTLVAILTSVISAVYYLNIIKQVFFQTPEYKSNPVLEKKNIEVILLKRDVLIDKFRITKDNIILSSTLSITISIITFILILFILIPEEVLNVTNVLTLILLNP
jgi:NADH-ubiquinone oxidoreductase chain 2